LDGRRNNGGHSTKGRAGRKSKAEELGLSQMMDSIMPVKSVLEALKPLVEEGDKEACKIWMAYRIGKPKETVEQTTRQSITIEDNTERGLP